MFQDRIYILNLYGERVFYFIAHFLPFDIVLIGFPERRERVIDIPKL